MPLNTDAGDGASSMPDGSAVAQAVLVPIDGAPPVSGWLLSPPQARACYVLAHGAGAGMDHPFMAAVAEGLAVRGVATLRYQFPFTQRGSRRVDPPRVAQAAVRAAAAEAARLLPGMALVAGGKSFGGRMTSHAQAAAPLPQVRGLAFLGFPLHPAGAPAIERAQHLDLVRIPMLFLQGTRDALADVGLMQGVAGRLGEQATLQRYEGADHSFHVLRRAGSNDAALLARMLDDLVAWIDRVVGAQP